MECTDLTEDTIKILGLYFSYNKKLEQEKNFLSHIFKIQKILKLWKLRNLTREGRIVIFMSLVISKIIHLALVTEILHQLLIVSATRRRRDIKIPLCLSAPYGKV